MPDSNPELLPQKSGALPMNHHFYLFLNLFFCSHVPILRPGVLYVMYNIWQDAGIRTRVAAILQPGVLTVLPMTYTQNFAHLPELTIYI